jgi:hypothetical protein
MANFYYFYTLDRDFGSLFIKFSTYFQHVLSRGKDFTAFQDFGSSAR